MKARLMTNRNRPKRRINIIIFPPLTIAQKAACAN